MPRAGPPMAIVRPIVNVKLPDEVGVPERTPPEVSVNPGGRLPLMTMNGSRKRNYAARCNGVTVRVAHGPVNVGGLRLIVGQGVRFPLRHYGIAAIFGLSEGPGY